MKSEKLNPKEIKETKEKKIKEKKKVVEEEKTGCFSQIIIWLFEWYSKLVSSIFPKETIHVEKKLIPRGMRLNK
jgi:hypothetical protein